MVYFQFFSRTRYMQYAATLSATLSMTCVALYTSWPSPTLPLLTSDNSPIGTTITASEASWVASSFLLGFIPGGIFCGWILSKLGPKISLLVFVVPTCFPWIAIVFAKSALILYIARFIAGVGCSIASATVSMYIAEVSDTDIRGKLGTATTILYLLGTLFVMSVGPFVSYTILAVSCSVFSLIFGATFWFMPDSPYYLVKINRKDEAYNNLIRLFAQNADKKLVQVQLDEVTRTIEYDMKNKSTLWELFTNPEYRKPLIILAGLKSLQQLCGSSAIETYMQTIIASSRSSISPEHSSVIFGVIQIITALFAAVLVDRAGRKPLLIISALGCALALSVEGVYFYFHDSAQHAIVDSMSWLPTTGLVLFLIMYSIGISPLTTVILGEIFPGNIKNQVVSLYTFYSGILSTLVVISFDPISKAFGMYITFSIFTAFCILGAIFILITLPETKGKTFAEIQNSFNNTKSPL